MAHLPGGNVPAPGVLSTRPLGPRALACPRGAVRLARMARAGLLLLAVGLSCHPPGRGSPAPGGGGGAVIRNNQLGYLPAAPKVAVVCALEPQVIASFRLVDERNRTVFGPRAAEAAGPFGPCAATYRLDFSTLQAAGVYRIVAAGVSSLPVRIAHDAYRGAADSLLAYLREQRSGYNPVFRDSVHQRSDGVLVDHPTRSGEFIPVSGGWADASDYLQYGATTAHATTMLLLAYRDHPEAFADRFQANGLPGANGIPDVLDEARWGLAWLLKMYPEDDLLLNQLGDDRDHAFWDLPVNDSSDYGWGRGGRRPVYPCTGKAQGLFEYKNRSTGLASTAGKYAAAFALGAREYRERDSVFARRLAERARAVYALGAAHPGVCQTAPARAPYFYEEDDWADDMELGAAELYALTREPTDLAAALAYAALEPVSPWMGQDTARHYQWYPWHNNGHYEIWRATRGPRGPGGPGGRSEEHTSELQSRLHLVCRLLLEKKKKDHGSPAFAGTTNLVHKKDSNDPKDRRREFAETSILARSILDTSDHELQAADHGSVQIA